MKLLFASAEIFPYAKTGGLADVAQALPAALAKQIEVLSVMPLYDFIDRKKFALRAMNESFQITVGKDIYDISLFEGVNRGVRTLFVYEALLCHCQTPYGNKNADTISKEQVKLLQKGTIADWANETQTFAIKVYGSAEAGEKLGYNYMYNNFGLVRSQLQKGGIRLAKVLNDLFG